MLPRAADTPSLARSESWGGGGGGFGGYESFDGAAAALPLGHDSNGGGEPELEVLVGAPEAVSDGMATDWEYPLRTRSSLPACVSLRGASAPCG
jgi:hypothetical protein